MESTHDQSRLERASIIMLMFGTRHACKQRHVSRSLSHYTVTAPPHSGSSKLDEMSFEHAPVTKGPPVLRWLHSAYTTIGLMVGIAMSSILVGVFDVKHYFHLQVSPSVLHPYAHDVSLTGILPISLYRIYRAIIKCYKFSFTFRWGTLT